MNETRNGSIAAAAVPAVGTRPSVRHTSATISVRSARTVLTKPSSPITVERSYPLLRAGSSWLVAEVDALALMMLRCHTVLRV
jgi:hypothetical protein